MSEQIVDVLTHLAMVTKGQEVDAGKFLAYALELQDIPPDELEYVCQWLGRNEEWFPSLAKIRQTWMEACLRDTVLTEGEAMNWVLHQMNRIGGFTASGAFIEPMAYPDPVVKETMRLFGWRRLAHAEDNDWTYKDFAKAYQQARETVARRVMAGELAPPPLALPEAQRPALKAVS